MMMIPEQPSVSKLVYFCSLLCYVRTVTKVNTQVSCISPGKSLDSHVFEGAQSAPVLVARHLTRELHISALVTQLCMHVLA